MARGLQHDLRSAIAVRYGLTLPGPWRRLSGGEECQVWRARASQAPAVMVVRVSPKWRTAEEIAWTHSVVRFAAAGGLTEAVAPIPARDGTSAFLHRAGVVALFPFIPGRTMDRSRPEERLAAAQLLGRLHRRLVHWPAAAAHRPRPPLGRPHPTDDRGPAPGEPPVLSDNALEAWHAERCAAADLTVAPLHGDYYRRNLRWSRGRVAGLIDWDEAHVGFLFQEAAWAAWEFAKSPAGDALDVPEAGRFLDAYRTAGGPCAPHEYGHATAFIRWRLRGEIRGNLDAAARGDPWDPDYVAANLRAFERLRGVSLSCATADAPRSGRARR